MNMNQRVRNYSKQIGVSSVGVFKSKSATTRFVAAKLTPAQQRRISKKTAS